MTRIREGGFISKMNRILVIGAKGMLGRDLMTELQASFPHDESMGWDIGEMDIREEEITVSRIEAAHPQIVINVAGYTNVDGCELNEKEAFAANAEGMKNIALGAKRCGAKVIYLSTDYIFDGEKGEPYLEEDPPHPINIYGRSKLKGEQYVRELTGDGLIIRTQWLFGRYGNNFVSAILRQARKKKVLSIVDDQIGCPTYTPDLSRAISAMIRQNARGIFHVTNEDPCSWYTFGQTILKFSGMEGVKVIPISSKELGRPAPRPSYSVLKTEKFKKETGWALRSWIEALREFLFRIRERIQSI